MADAATAESFAEWHDDDDNAPLTGQSPEGVPPAESEGSPQHHAETSGEPEGEDIPTNEEEDNEATNYQDDSLTTQESLPPASEGSKKSASDSSLKPISVEEMMRPDIQPDKSLITTAITMRDRLADLPENTGYGSRRTLIQIGDEEAAFVLGKSGRTKHKIAKVSGCRVNLTPNLQLELIGTPEQRDRAELYVKLVIQQRRGRVCVNFGAEARNDLTVIDVPTNSVAFVTGQGGHVLRAIEEEWSTLMFFVKYDGPAVPPQKEPELNGAPAKSEQLPTPESGDVKEEVEVKADPPEEEEAVPPAEDYSVPVRDRDRAPMPDDGSTERLLIFGDMRGRRGAELKVMSAVEQKNPRRYSSLYTGEYISEAEGFDTDRTIIGVDDFSYSLGKDGSTRRKLAKAAHCVLEYIGRIAFFAGTKIERTRCREYLQWLIEQRTRPIHVDVSVRTDVTSVSIPKELVKAIAGPRGSTLRQLECTSQTFCFIDAQSAQPDRERLLIFSHSLKARELARKLLYDTMDSYVARQGLGHDEYVYEAPASRSPRGQHWHADLMSNETMLSDFRSRGGRRRRRNRPSQAERAARRAGGGGESPERGGDDRDSSPHKRKKDNIVSMRTNDIRNTYTQLDRSLHRRSSHTHALAPSAAPRDRLYEDDQRLRRMGPPVWSSGRYQPMEGPLNNVGAMRRDVYGRAASPLPPLSQHRSGMSFERLRSPVLPLREQERASYDPRGTRMMERRVDERFSPPATFSHRQQDSLPPLVISPENRAMPIERRTMQSRMPIGRTFYPEPEDSAHKRRRISSPPPTMRGSGAYLDSRNGPSPHFAGPPRHHEPPYGLAPSMRTQSPGEPFHAVAATGHYAASESRRYYESQVGRRW